MQSTRKHWLAMVLFSVLLLCGAANLRAAADSLVWHKQQERVDADIHAWPLPRLLEKVAAATGWQVYLEPSASHEVSVKFKDLPSGQALRSLLGDLNFVMIPETNAPSRLYVFRTSLQQATRRIRAPAKADTTATPIPNQIVVTLKPGSKTKIEDLARMLGAKIIRRMDDKNSYLLQFEDAAATDYARTQLADNPDVQSTDSNYAFAPPPNVDFPLDGATPDLQLKPKDNDGNCQLVIGMPDTPFQSLGSNLDAFMKPVIHVAGNYQPPATQLTHGTAMAETALKGIQQAMMKSASTNGTATSIKIQPVDVYGASETTTTFDVANGIVQAVNNGANVINLSLGGSGDSQFLHNIIIQVTQQGIPIYAAAGNEPVTTPTYPAAYPEVVAVTASDQSGKLADYANRGSFIDMIAPGDNVVGFNGQSYLVEGTSTSTAIASGLAAGFAYSAGACADQAQSLLQKALKPASLKP
ncbi:MAG: hypothetical protein JWR19_1913 [Pedosphaera sp.]|nr:hypothetical protein [Pedosphaera sp.]